MARPWAESEAAKNHDSTWWEQVRSYSFSKRVFNDGDFRKNPSTPFLRKT